MSENPFGYLSDYEVKADKTIEIPITELVPFGGYGSLRDDGRKRGYPTLICRPATQSNKPYFNALLKSGQKHARRMRRGKMTAQQLDETRDEDRKLYPKFVVVGWIDVDDAGGNEVGFSAPNLIFFLNNLPDWIFDRVRNDLSDPSQFLPDQIVDSDDVEETAGNLPSESSGNSGTSETDIQ